MLKIQTDGTFTPIQAVQQACDDLIRTLVSMKNQFQNEVLKARARGDDDGMDGGDGGGMTF